MKVILCICCLLNPLSLTFGQTIAGQIRDSKTKLPIQYVNIGIVGKNIGTISDAQGNFRLSLATISDSDSLRISMIGYLSKEYKIGAIDVAGFPKIIYMDERIILLQEAVMGNENETAFQFGLEQKYCYPIPLYKGAESKVAFPQKNYRHEIGTRFSNSRTITLDSIQLNVAECNVDRLDFRLNIYSIHDDVIENRLSKPIYITLSKSDALNSPRIDLSGRGITIDSDFLITIENYKQLKDGAIYLFANFKRRAKAYPTYYKDGIQGNWVQLKTKKLKPIGISILAFGH